MPKHSITAILAANERSDQEEVEEQAKMQVHKEGTGTEEDRQKEDHQWLVLCRIEME